MSAFFIFFALALFLGAVIIILFGGSTGSTNPAIHSQEGDFSTADWGEIANNFNPEDTQEIHIR